MKKQLNYITVGILVGSLVLSACSKPANDPASATNASSATSISSVSEDEASNRLADNSEELNLFDIPKGFTKGYEEAKFEKYNSYASDNGLGNTPIWIEGNLDNVSKVGSGDSAVFMGQVLLDDDNLWLVALDGCIVSDKKTYSELIDHRVCIAGIYQGFSDVYEAPSMTMNKLFDRSTGDLLESILFVDFTGESDEKVITSDFDKKTNLKISYHGVNFQIPESWSETKESGDYTYYYPEDGMLMLYFQKVDDSSLEIKEEDMDSYMEGIKEGFDEYGSESVKKINLKNSDRDAYQALFEGSINDMYLNVKLVLFKTYEGLVTLMYSDMENSSYDRMDDFEKVIESIEFNDKPKADPTPTEKPAPTEKPTPTVTPASSNATTGERNALNKAKSYLDFTAFSYAGLIEQLEYEGFSTEEATYGADHCGADWNEQAKKKSKSYLDFTAFSYTGLIEQLEFEGFTTEQATYGADNCGADWFEQAAKKAESYLSFTSFSRDGLIDQLVFEGFTYEQAEYGASANGF